MALIRRPIFRVIVFLLTLLGSAIGLSVGNYIAVIFFSSLSGSLVLFPNRNPALYWPFGLALSIVSLYGVYVAMWLFGIRGVTTDKANIFFLGLMVFFTALWIIHITLTKSPWKEDLHPTAFIFIILVVTSLMIFAVHRSLVHPELLIADHLAGGDHGIHIQYINGLASGSEAIHSSPFSLQDYPKGIHFVIALLFTIHEPTSSYTKIVDIHIVVAVFEYIQLAAFLQLLLLVTLTQLRRRVFMQICFVSSLLVLFLSIPKSINHLFWSGFTTSLALTWILLLPLAMPWSTVPSGCKEIKAGRLYFWLVLSVLVWIVYQPYVIVTMSFVVAELLWRLRKLFRRDGVAKAGKLSVFKIGLIAPTITFLSPLFMLVLLGQESESIKRLTLFGVSWKVGQGLLLFTVITTFFLFGIYIRLLRPNRQVFDDVVFYSAIVTFTIGFAIVAAATSAFTMMNQPYYIQKMYWIIFFLGFVIGAKWLLSIAVSITFEGRKWLNGLLGVLLPTATLLPLIVTRNSPSEALDRISIRWFAKGLMVDVSDVKPYNAAAFHTWENLGAHVGNIALKEVTGTYLAVDVAQSRNPYWACWTMRRSKVNVIYTATGQGSSLLDAGCSQFVTYVEDNLRIDRLIPKTAQMVINKEIPLHKGTRSKRFLITGFPKQDESGAVANGFHSTIQMVSTRDATNASASFSISKYAEPTRPVSIELVIDGVESQIFSVEPQTNDVTLQLPLIKKGSLISFHFVCGREESEVIGALDNPQILECLTVKNFKITVPN